MVIRILVVVVLMEYVIFLFILDIHLLFTNINEHGIFSFVNHYYP